MVGMAEEFNKAHRHKHAAGHKLSRQEVAELKEKKQAEQTALNAAVEAHQEMTKMWDHIVGKEDVNEGVLDPNSAEHEAKLEADAVLGKENVERMDKILRDLFIAIRFNPNVNAFYYWRAEAYRIRAVVRRPRPGHVGNFHQIEPTRVLKAQKEDLKKALADCDHALRFYSADCIEAASQSYIVWQLRGRVRAQLGHEDFEADYAKAKSLDPTCAMTYLLWGRSLWRGKQFEKAVLKYEEGLKHPHSDTIKEQMQIELAELRKQMGEWKQWEDEEAQRCACTVM